VRVRRGALSSRRRADVRQLLQLHLVSAGDRRWVRHQCNHRDLARHFDEWLERSGTDTERERTRTDDSSVPICHVALWSHYGGRMAMAFVRTGTLDAAAAVTPDAFIFTRSKLPWMVLPPEIPAFEIYYDMEALWPAESLARRAAALEG